MADETFMERAIALLPGSDSGKKKRASASAARHKQLGAIQKKLAVLSRNVEKLAATIAKDAKKAVSSKPAAKKPATRRAPARKPAAKKPAAGKRATGAKRTK